MPSPWLHSRFVTFLRSRRALQYFRRRPMLESLRQDGHTLPMQPVASLSQALRQASEDDAETA